MEIYIMLNWMYYRVKTLRSHTHIAADCLLLFDTLTAM